MRGLCAWITLVVCTWIHTDQGAKQSHGQPFYFRVRPRTSYAHDVLISLDIDQTPPFTTYFSTANTHASCVAVFFSNGARAASVCGEARMAPLAMCTSSADTEDVRTWGFVRAHVGSAGSVIPLLFSVRGITDQNSRTRTPPRSSAIDIFSSVTVKIRQLECGALVDAGLEAFNMM